MEHERVFFFKLWNVKSTMNLMEFHYVTTTYMLFFQFFIKLEREFCKLYPTFGWIFLSAKFDCKVGPIYTHGLACSYSILCFKFAICFSISSIFLTCLKTCIIGYYHSCTMIIILILSVCVWIIKKIKS